MALETKPHSPDSDAPSVGSQLEKQTVPDTKLFHLLQTSRRREAIRYLLNTAGAVQMREVANYVAATEHETSTTELSPEQYQRVYIPLYQSHLPKLDEHGVIKYEQSRGVVRPTDRLERFRPYLELAPHNDSDVHPAGESKTSSGRDVDSYIAAAALGGLLLSAVVMDLLFIPGVVLGGIIISLFLAATIVTER